MQAVPQRAPTRYFYPRSPCGERHVVTTPLSPNEKFLSTLSLRRATVPAAVAIVQPMISIHALLAESDTSARCAAPCARSISIHALLAESDQSTHGLMSTADKFLSTLSLRRATAMSCARTQRRTYFYPRSPCGERQPLRRRSTRRIVISIHALLAESDPCAVCSTTTRPHFYPRSPCGERLQHGLHRNNPLVHFYPRSPCGERRI